MAALSNPHSPEFLGYCVKHALDDEDLAKDIVEACVMCDIDAVTLANGLSDPKEAAEKLYLTEAEARILIETCKKMINKEDGVQDVDTPVSPVEAMQIEEEAVPVDMETEVASEAPAPVQETEVVTEARVEEQESVKVEEKVVIEDEVIEDEVIEDVSSPVAAPVPTPEILLPTKTKEEQIVSQNALDLDIEPNFSTLQPETKLPEVTTPKKKEIEEDSFFPEPCTSPIHTVYQSPAPASSSTPSRPFSAVTKGSKANLSRSAVLEPSASRWKSSHVVASPGHIPSYLRPTEAMKNRVSVTALPTTPEMKQSMSKRPQSATLRMMSPTLLAPTQSFLAHRDNKDDKSPVVRKSTVLLESVLSSPQGQRVTRPKPFCLSTELRPKSCVLSKEELDIIEAKEKAFRSTPVPKFVREQRPVNPRTITTPKKPSDIFEPFNLASLKLHEAMEEARRKKLQENRSAEDSARKFKALELTKEVLEGEEQKKPVAAPVTKVNGFVFKSEDRIKYHHDVLDPIKKAKEEEAAKIAEEEARKKKEAEDLAFGNIRRNTEFKAGTMPDFTKPFKPDPAQSRPVTRVAEFKLATTSRLGEPVSPTPEDKVIITDSNFLRSSLSLTPIAKKSRGVGSSTADLRRSAVHAAA